MLSRPRVPNISLSVRAIAPAAPVRARLQLLRQSTARANLSTSTPLRTADDRLTSHTKLPPYHPVGVARALQASPTTSPVGPTIFAHEFSLADRVALVSGAHRGIGLEMALAFIEAGARAVYCVDLPKTPDESWVKVREHARALAGAGRSGAGAGGEGRLEYVSADVRDQDGMWKVGKTIGDREGRMDACVAAAGVLPARPEPCLTHSAEQFQAVSVAVLDVNVRGALFTAQAAGQQMARFGRGGSVILMASVMGHGMSKDTAFMSYSASKSAVLQLARSMACELGPQGIRVNSISPSAIRTPMMENVLSPVPGAEKAMAEAHVLGRIGRADELRGVVVWLASDASSFCTGSDFFVSGGYQGV
ncbi:hypothetical protein GSI_11054 [Ganoderma sinense ZZ0214-1]|uniref:Uncharacterized protein n=1 Tax=Ganoderma sinense ZZ0214-1 TaxID=1077348 RepID=A0A2G8RZG1_9APHY|nr:hypothetical protein GSI_11054 [Ganoderma sinense ZZ0214-1]